MICEPKSKSKWKSEPIHTDEKDRTVRRDCVTPIPKKGGRTMKKLLDVIYGTALLLIFGVALLADLLAEIPHGFIILFGIVAAGGVLVLIGNRLEVRR